MDVATTEESSTEVVSTMNPPSENKRASMKGELEATKKTKTKSTKEVKKLD